LRDWRESWRERSTNSEKPCKLACWPEMSLIRSGNWDIVILAVADPAQTPSVTF
jgi:hypothetical protein